MKFTITLLTAAVAVSAAQPHHHGHQHLHEKRDPTPAADVEYVPGPTEVVYVLNGKTISEDEVNRGIANGTLVWASGSLAPAAPKVEAAAVSSPSSTPTTTSTTVHTTSSAAPPPPPPTTSSTSTSTTSSAAPPPTSSAQAAWTAASKSSDSSSSTGVDSPFPDGQLDCSHFPSDYGAVPVSWLNLGGWTGVQSPGSNSGGLLNDIETIVSSLCLGGNCCQEGMYCSYACPAGYQKSQWPTSQGATGQSIGGVLCKNGKLQLTNPGMSKSLCMTGSTAVNVQVQNTLGQNVAVCRTDYPGTESETVPLNVEPGETDKLTCPDSNNYYTWQGGKTSAQYYVNPAGVAVEDACQWGSASNPWGNFAPLNLGVGYSNGAAWLSIFQNSPTTSAHLGFTVEIKGDALSDSCKYSNGQYCSSTGCNAQGCTVSAASGSATFIFS